MAEKSERLLSIDVLRGFDMFFISGGASLIVALCTALGCGDCALATQMRHVPWAGFAQHDTIFPLFLFLAGVSWPFSLASQEAKGRGTGAICRKILMRMLVLFFIEVSFGGLLKFKPDFRLMGVLSYIGLSWGVATLISLKVRKFAGRAALVAGLLLAQWALLRFGIAADAPLGADSYAKEWNLFSYLDRTVWPTHLYKSGVYDPESFFSLLGGVAMALTGVCSGSWLRCQTVSPRRRAVVLALAALGFLVADGVFVLLLGDQVVKALWSASFVLSAATYSLALLALFYWLIDVKGWKRWTFYFKVIGMNSILIYLMGRLGVTSTLGRFLFEGLAQWAGNPWSAVISAVGMLAAGWGVLYVMYRKNAFLRI